MYFNRYRRKQRDLDSAGFWSVDKSRKTIDFEGEVVFVWVSLVIRKDVLFVCKEEHMGMAELGEGGWLCL